MRFDVHQGINPVIGLGILGKDVFNQVAVSKQVVNSPLEHAVAHHILL